MAARFDNSADVLTRNTNIPSKPITAMAWVYLSSDLNNYQTFFRIGGAAGEASYILDTFTDGVTFNLWNGSGDVSSSTAMIVGVWYHAAIVLESGGTDGIRAYLNGTLAITATGDIDTTTFYLGVLSDGSERLDGRMADFIVYDRVLTERQIKKQMLQYVPFERVGLNTFSPLRYPAEFAVNYGGSNGLWTTGGTITEEAGPPIPWILPLRKRVYFVPGGGVLYTATLAASLSPAGLVVKQVNKLLGGVASPSGLLRKQVNKVLAASVTPSGNVVKRGLKVLSGVISPVGTVMVTAIYAIVLSGAIAVSGVIVKQVQKRLAGALTPSGNLMKQGNKVLGGVITPVGSLIKQVNKVLGGTVTPVGALVVRATYSVILAGTLGVVGSLTKQVNKVLTASLVPTGLVSKQKNMSLAASLAISGNVVKQVQKVLGATLSPTGALTTARRLVVVLAGALAPVGTLVKQVNKRLFASVAVSGGIVKQVNKVVNGAVSPVGTVRKQVSKVLQATVTPVGALTGNRIFQVVLSGVLGVSGAVASVFINGSGVVMQGLVPWIRRRRR